MDHLIGHLDQAMKSLGAASHARRRNPAEDLPEPAMSPEQTRRSIGMMRVNHAGEIAAQALYQGQSFTARSVEVREALTESALEENDHLCWCRERLEELGGNRSRLDPAWFSGSLLIGVLAGIAGDRVSLGFLAETERQVVVHLQSHLEALPQPDTKSRVILEQMCADEAGHATTAVEQGAAELPTPVKTLMRYTARVMTKTAFHI